MQGGLQLQGRDGLLQPGELLRAEKMWTVLLFLSNFQVREQKCKKKTGGGCACCGKEAACCQSAWRCLWRSLFCWYPEHILWWNLFCWYPAEDVSPLPGSTTHCEVSHGTWPGFTHPLCKSWLTLLADKHKYNPFNIKQAIVKIGIVQFLWISS